VLLVIIDYISLRRVWEP